jgi:AraC family transcriptional regulator
MTHQLEPGKFHGTKMREHQVSGFVLTEYLFAPRRAIPKHCHEQTYLSFVLEGGWSETFDNRVRERSPLTLTIHPAGEIHSEVLDSRGASAFHVEFSPTWLLDLEDYARVFARPAQIESGPLTWLALRLHSEFLHVDLHSPLVIEGILLESAAALARGSADESRSGLPPWLTRAREILHARFSENLSLGAIAREVEIHPVHLARTFRRHYERTIGEYLQELRVRHACRQLLTSDRPISQIALASGFYDQSHLSRVMRRLTGLAPAATRRNRTP